MLKTWYESFASRFESVRDDRLRLCLFLTLALLVLFVANFDALFLRDGVVGTHGQQDYNAFHGAGRAAATGFTGNLYDPLVFQEVLGGETTLLWLYPPHMLFLLMPFGVLDAHIAKLLMILCTFVCAYGVFRLASSRFEIGLLGMIAPASYVALNVGQLSGLFGLFLTAGLILSRKRPVLAGICLGLLTVKPQLGLLVIPFLLFTRAWKTILYASVTSMVLIAGSVLAFGFEMWVDFLASLTQGTHADYYDTSGHSGRYTISDALKGIGISPPPAWLLYWPLIALAIAGMARLARDAKPDLVISYTLLATAVVTPYMFAYDYLFVHAGILVAMLSLTRVHIAAAWTLMALWFAPLLAYSVTKELTPTIVWPLMFAGTLIIFCYGARLLKQPVEPEPLPMPVST